MSTARELAYKTLRDVVAGVKLDDATNEVFTSKSGLDVRDEHFYLQLVKTVLRNQNLLDYQVERNSDRCLSKIDSDILVLLRLGITQLHLMETAEYAALNETVELTKRIGRKGAAGFVNGVMRSILREGIQYPNLHPEKPAGYLSVMYSHPRWLVKRWLDNLGYDDTEALLKVDNTLAPTTAVFRPGVDVESNDKGELSAGPLGTCVLTLGSRLRDFPLFAAGNLLIVDASSTLGVAALGPPPNATVGDFASGVGGKAIQLAWRVGDNGKVIAIDNNAKRMQLLRANLKKYDISNVHAALTDLTKGISIGFDYILLDAPCSNTGVLRRKPDIRWRLRSDDIYESAALQKSLVSSAFNALNNGGILVYETCSMEPEENEDIIEWGAVNLEGAVIENAAARIEPRLREELGEGPYINVYPHTHNCNGAFIAALRRE